MMELSGGQNSFKIGLAV